MTNNKYLDTDFGKVSIQASCSELDGIIQPMQLYIVMSVH